MHGIKRKIVNVLEMAAWKTVYTRNYVDDQLLFVPSQKPSYQIQLLRL